VPLVRQVQIGSDIARRGTVRLAELEATHMEDKEIKEQLKNINSEINALLKDKQALLAKAKQ